MYIFSNEIVFRGHPDKVCDQISDALLDAYLKDDGNSRCAIEVMGGKGAIFITGEVTSLAEVDVEDVARRVLRDVGYPSDFYPSGYMIYNNIGTQSPDIALGTNEEVGGAGDQGLMFGYAERGNDMLMPKAVTILQRLSRKYDDLVHSDSRFLPDGKAQITGMYTYDGRLVGIDTFLVSYNNTEEDRQSTDAIITKIITDLCLEEGLNIGKILINPTGKFLIGGFEGDAGLTGRKIIVDTYQGFARHGGGAFSGKDPTKVDRSAAYMARYLAKWVVYNNFADRCEVQLSYSIGVAEPVGLTINTFGSAKESEVVIEGMIRRKFDLTPKGIICFLNLRNIKYENLAAFGHIGREDIALPWELVAETQSAKIMYSE